MAGTYLPAICISDQPELRTSYCMKGILVYVPFLWVEGLAFFPFIFSKNKHNGKVFLHHEGIHLCQQLEMGILLFYVWYLTEYLFRLLHCRNHYRAYRAISFEKEAYDQENQPDYLLSRPFWAFLKYL